MTLPKFQRRPRRPFGLILSLLLLLGSALLGWGLAQAATPSNPLLVQQPLSAPMETVDVGTVDVVPQKYQLGQQLYRDSCGSCHLALPPQTFATQTWQQLLQDPNHYGARLQLPVDPQRQLIWRYLQTFSRPLKEGEQVPYRLGRSRYFKILHPQVEIPKPINVASCASCHLGAADYNFRALAPQQNSLPVKAPSLGR